MSTSTPSLDPEAILQVLWDKALSKFKSVLLPDFQQLSFFAKSISIYVQSNPEISALICGSVCVLLEFFLQAAIFFGRNPIVNILGISLKWRKQQKFRAEFARFLGTIRENTRWIDLEANIALHNLSHDLTSRGHREILASMSAMRTTSATSLPATGVTASTASKRKSSACVDYVPALPPIATTD
ncbi:predicted protein [Chaetomium globosum CBS 148.51]|uniref:Uncharacterized protein n=1 Tax=Chaetomium globosum (strain ATCC 6205 / CBS 148.51 / DSM 1962 / NBRC 6347 / NRRL 1970) TaxID=306901 RepID=Q2HF61_CHAGB|nr:predicted protein [Chaetomium globosum CBS 148.51]